MNHILALAFMGLLAGALAGFWTRIIGHGMILFFINKKIAERNRQRVMETGMVRDGLLYRFINCIFCVTPYLVLLFDGFYVVVYTPAWYLCVIGVFASLGAGNLIAEIIYALRGRE